MPTLCKNANCRNPAVYGYSFKKPLYCSEHRPDDAKNTKFITESAPNPESNETKCASHPLAPSKYKGYCVNCYINTYPDDPLTLQTLYKSKIVASQKYIDIKFDGFVHGHNFSEIKINNKTLRILFGEITTRETKVSLERTEEQGTDKHSLYFNLNKYEDGSNPQLYTRLPKLEQLISCQLETLLTV